MSTSFIDTANIQLKSGNGGNGCSSFRREKFVPLGGPDGGDGGKGGDIILEVDPQLHTLMDLRYKRNYKAGRGVHGQGKKKFGRGGEDCIIRVPPGTEIYENDELLIDLIEPGQQFIAAKGGDGGRGNARFSTPTNQAPTKCETGWPGEEKTLTLVLKILADIGLVGLPNAGKSTLLSQLSNATPKIADYPFTTLKPNLGEITSDDYLHFVMADIPGIIEGAADGKGLGLEFLKHIERSRALLFLIDATEEEPEFVYEVLKEEIEQFNPEILEKPRALVITKCDLPDAPDKLTIADLEPNVQLFHISSITRDGLEPLRTYLVETMQRLEAEEPDSE